MSSFDEVIGYSILVPSGFGVIFALNVTKCIRGRSSNEVFHKPVRQSALCVSDDVTIFHDSKLRELKENLIFSFLFGLYLINCPGIYPWYLTKYSGMIKRSRWLRMVWLKSIDHVHFGADLRWFWYLLSGRWSYSVLKKPVIFVVFSDVSIYRFLEGKDSCVG